MFLKFLLQLKKINPLLYGKRVNLYKNEIRKELNKGIDYLIVNILINKFVYQDAQL